MTKPSPRAAASAASARAEADPIPALVEAWAEDFDRLGVLLSRRGWAEDRLPEDAEPIRRLTRGIDELHERLDWIRAEVARLEPLSREGALAKLDLALRITEPDDCETDVWALLEGAREGLRARAG